MAARYYCVYKHFVSGELIYIGSGIESRPYSWRDRNSTWKRKVGKGAPDVEIVEKFKTADEAYLLEQRLIGELRPKANRQLSPHRPEKFTHTFAIPMKKSTLVKLRKLCNQRGYSMYGFMGVAVEVALRNERERMKKIPALSNKY
jgi:hypothetical protein